jgi:hypothetical protein
VALPGRDVHTPERDAPRSDAHHRAHAPGARPQRRVVKRASYEIGGGVFFNF